MNQEPAEITNMAQANIEAIENSAHGIEKRPYRAPSIVEFAPCVWALSGGPMGGSGGHVP